MIGSVNQPSTHLIMDADGTLKADAVDVEGVLADNVVTAAKIADNVIGSDYLAGTDLTLKAIADIVADLQSLLWWKVDSAERIQNAGILQAMAATSGVSGGAVGGRTFISSILNERVRQDGYIRRCAVNIKVAEAGVQMKFKVFRYSGGTYTMVSESETVDIANSTGLQTFDLATPMSCECGDIFGFWINAKYTVNVGITTRSGSRGLRYVAGDITTSDAFSSEITAYSLDVAAYSAPPFLAATGDSIPEGHNGASNWHGYLHVDAGPAGEPTSEIFNQLRSRLGAGNSFEYQNMSLGSQTFAWVLSTGAPAAIAVQPRAILIHCGVNDIATARSWANVEADLDGIAALITTEDLWIDEILPWTNGSDGQAATVRTWNDNLATWCAANGAHLIACHDAMGQVRSGTGELDDLKTAYDQDGVHLSTAGVDALAQIIKTALQAYYG